jgi:NTP pyrophosphatase (non-canonical NTP hydrolase)
MGNPLSLGDSVELRNKRVADTAVYAEGYAAFTITTARYPTEISELAGSVTAAMLYTSVGIANEVGELAELFDQEAHREDLRAERYAKAWKELGDVQWYVARLCAECPEVAAFDLFVMRAMQRLRDGNYRETRLSGYDLQSALCVHAGRVLGVVKKMMRDGRTWTATKRAEKIVELSNALQEIVNVSAEYAEHTGPLVGCEGGYERLLFDNRMKLSGRLERGTLQGDGDVR